MTGITFYVGKRASHVIYFKQNPHTAFDPDPYSANASCHNSMKLLWIHSAKDPVSLSQNVQAPSFVAESMGSLKNLAQVGAIVANRLPEADMRVQTLRTPFQ